VQSSNQIITTNKSTPNFLQAGCPTLSPNQQCRSTDGKPTQYSLWVKYRQRIKVPRTEPRGAPLKRLLCADEDWSSPTHWVSASDSNLNGAGCKCVFHSSSCHHCHLPSSLASVKPRMVSQSCIGLTRFSSKQALNECSVWMSPRRLKLSLITYEWSIVSLTSCLGGCHNMPPPLQVDLWPPDLESGLSHMWRGLPLCQFQSS